MSDGELSAEADDPSAHGDSIPSGRVRRASSLAGLTARTAGESIAIGMRAKWTGAEDPGFHERTAERYAELLGRSKGVLMKAGQMLSFLTFVPVTSAETRSIYQTALERLTS